MTARVNSGVKQRETAEWSERFRFRKRDQKVEEDGLKDLHTLERGLCNSQCHQDLFSMARFKQYKPSKSSHSNL